MGGAARGRFFAAERQCDFADFAVITKRAGGGARDVYGRLCATRDRRWGWADGVTEGPGERDN